MKKMFRSLVLLLLLLAVSVYWFFFSSATSFSEKTKYFIISNTGKEQVVEALANYGIIKHPSAFALLGSSMDIWKRIRPGKYEVKKGDNLVSIARMLKNGKQAEIKLVITGVRIKENLARLIARNFAPDSTEVMQFLNSNDSLKPFGVDTNTVFTLIIPDTYLFYWNTPLASIFKRLADYKDLFWQKNNRIEKAKALGLTPEEVYILASIVEEETNFASDKYKIASVYLNRLNKSMPLQACPTIKFAMRDFTLTRIYDKYLFNPSPYNTYRRKGLPPGPICTPSSKTIDIVLDAPKTDYLFFVAKSDFSGYHHFSSDYKEHSQYAKEYQKALDSYMARKQQQQKQ
jgi:UPF0755 protein